MLVLSRKARESIMVGHDVIVTVLSVSRDQVRLGIQAPSEVEVHRREVYLAIQEANRAAAAASTGDGMEGLAAMFGAGRKPAQPARSAQSEDSSGPPPDAPWTDGGSGGVIGTATP